MYVWEGEVEPVHQHRLCEGYVSLIWIQLEHFPHAHLKQLLQSTKSNVIWK